MSPFPLSKSRKPRMANFVVDYLLAGTEGDGRLNWAILGVGLVRDLWFKAIDLRGHGIV